MKAKAIFMIAVLLSAIAMGGQLVDQGAAGTAAWKVNITATNATFTLDGGNVSVNNSWVYLDGGITNVNVIGTVPVSGTVAVSGTTTVSGTVNVGTVTSVGPVASITDPVRLIPSAAAWTRISATEVAVPTNGTPCTTAGGASCTTIVASTAACLLYQNMTFWVINAGANPLTNLLLEFSPDAVNWEIWNSTTFAGLAASGVLSLALTGNSRRYLRVEGRSASGTSVTVYVDCTSQVY